MSVSIEITMESAAWEKLPGAEAAVRRAVEAALRDEHVNDGEIGIVLADDARIQALNKNFRGTDKATNVLAFPAPKHRGPMGRSRSAISCSPMRRSRAKPKCEGKTAEHHLMHLAVHGTLHLLGFDHNDEVDAEMMEARERAILAGLGIPDPYAHHENAGAAA